VIEGIMDGITLQRRPLIVRVDQGQTPRRSSWRG